MKKLLIDVRLDEERLRKARMLRQRAVIPSDLVREAIDTRFDAALAVLLETCLHLAHEAQQSLAKPNSPRRVREAWNPPPRPSVGATDQAVDTGLIQDAV